MSRVARHVQRAAGADRRRGLRGHSLFHPRIGSGAGACDGLTCSTRATRCGSHQLKRPKSATAAGKSSARTTLVTRELTES